MVGFWTALLRICGIVMLLLGVVGGFLRTSSFVARLNTFDGFYEYLLPIAVSLTLTVFFFATAAGLERLQKLDERIVRATARRRRPQAEEKDIAPVAPNWPEQKLGIHPQMIERRLARSHRMGTDNMAELFEREFMEWQRERRAMRSESRE